MRRLALAGLLAVLFASHATAQSAPYKVTVTDTEVKLRAGASDQFPETGTLRKGSVVVVEKEENGWLAVTAYGSVSWVATQFIEDPTPDKAAPKNVFVHAEEEGITLAAGKVGLDQPLDIRRVKVPNGTTLVVLGPKVTYLNRTWYMVQSPPGDVRYLPKTAVQFDKPAVSNFTVRVNESVTPLPPGGSPSAAPATPAGGPLATVPGPAITPATGGVTSGKPAVNHPLWAQAETAERENRLADAEKLYFQLAEEMNRTGGDHDIANLCYTRIHTIREKQRVARGTNTPLPTTPASTLRLPAKDDRGVRPGTPEPLPPAASTKDERTDTQSGLLRRSALTPDGPNRQLYILESPQGDVKTYVTAGQGVDLGRYLGRRVDVTGTTTTRTGLSKPYLIATAVELAP